MHAKKMEITIRTVEVAKTFRGRRDRTLPAPQKLNGCVDRVSEKKRKTTTHRTNPDRYT